MGIDNLLLDAITTVDTSPMYPLGMRFTYGADEGPNRDPAVSGSKRNRGEQEWIYVYNDSGVSIVQGSVVVKKAGTTTYNVRLSTQAAPQNPSQVVGIGAHTIVTGSYGWIIRKGYCEVLADTGGITADTAIVVGNAVDGRADDAAAATGNSFGYSTETVLATALATCWVNCTG